MVRYLCVMLILVSCPLFLKGQHPFSFFHLKPGIDLPDQPVHQISQDSRGEIWIATGNGLVSLNGLRSKLYVIPDGLSTNDIRVVLHNEDGSAWIATTGRLVTMTPEGEFIKHNISYIRESRIFDIARDLSNRVWFLGGEQIFCLDSLENVKAWSKGETGLSGAWRIDHEDMNGGILITSPSGSVRMTEKGPTPVANHFMSTVQHGHIYLGSNTADSRRYVFDEQTLALLGGKNGGFEHRMTVLQADLSSVFNDHEGNIWAGTRSDGLYLLSSLQIEMLYDHLERSHSSQRTSQGGESGLSMLANDGLRLTKDNQVQLTGDDFRRWDLPKEERIQHLIRVHNGWLAASSSYLFSGSISEDSVQVISLPRINDLDLAGNDQILISLGNRFHYQLESSRVSELFRASSPADWLSSHGDWAQEGFSKKGVISSDGSWMILVDGGIIVKPAEDARQETGAVSIAGEYLELIAWDSSTVIAPAKQGGLQVFQKGESINSANPISNWTHGPIKKVVVDRERQQLWVLANQGLVLFEGLESLVQSTEGYLIPGSQPISKTFSSAAVSTNGLDVLINDEVWTTSVPVFPPVPNIDLEVNCIYISDSPCLQAWQGTRKIPFDSTDLTFEFFVGSFSFLESQIFEYSLDGEGWVPIQDGRISLKKLPFGEYHLFLRLRSGDKMISGPKEVLGFIITPPFYQSWWFVFLAAIMLIGLIWAGLNLYYGENERRKLEVLVEQRTKDLDHSIIELQQKNQDLEQFAYIASHDLKSPLRGMIGHLQLLERKYSDLLGDQGRQSMSHAVGEAKRMYEMVNDLLNFASVGSEKLIKRKVTMDNMLKNLILGMSRQLDEIGGHIEIGPMPVVEVVPGQWETLFRNLLENGLKFNTSPDPTISITCEKEDFMYHFYVTDNGIGMDEKYQIKAFELYGRLNPEYPGTGIGLAICKKVIERHEGEIWIDSKIGSGTTFHFTVPIVDPRQEDADM